MIQDNAITDQQFDSLIKENVGSMIRDEDIRSLKPGSEEFRSAVIEKYNSQEKTPKSDNGGSTQKVEEQNSDDEQTTDNQHTNEKTEKVSENVQRRFDRLTAERTAAQTELAQLKSRLEALEGKSPAKESTPTNNTSTFSEPEPDVTRYETLPQYAKAIAVWEAKKAMFERDQNAKTQVVNTSFNNKGAELEKELGLATGEWNLTISNPDIKSWLDVKEMIYSSDVGHKIAYEIGKTPESIAAFNKLDHNRQIAFVGKLEDRFESMGSSEQTTKQAATSKAPVKRPPTKLPVGNSGTSTSGHEVPLKDGKIDMDSYRKWRKGTK